MRACAAPLPLAVDRWRGLTALLQIAIVRGVGGALRPGYRAEVAASEAQSSSQACRAFAPRHRRLTRRVLMKLLAEAGVPNLKLKLTNRNVPMPTRQCGVFLIDQVADRRDGRAQNSSRRGSIQAALSGGNYEAGLDFNCDFRTGEHHQIPLCRQVADQLQPC